MLWQLLDHPTASQEKQRFSVRVVDFVKMVIATWAVYDSF